MTFARWFMTLTFVLLLTFANSVISLVFFLAIYLAGWLCRSRAWFWKASVVFFALMAFQFTLPVFGGFEPDANGGAIGQGRWFSAEVLMFALLVLSTLAAFVGGLREEARARRATVGICPVGVR